MKIKFRINIFAATGLALLAGIMLSMSVGTAQTPTPNCCAPPFTANVVKPNIMITLDMTGSMHFRACMTLNGGRYDSTRTYYGYYDPTKKYSYASNRFYIDASGMLPGNMMNFAVMSRMDVARKALAGGKGQPTTSVNKHVLEAEGENYGWDSTTFGWPASLDYTNTLGPSTILSLRWGVSRLSIKNDPRGGVVTDDQLGFAKSLMEGLPPRFEPAVVQPARDETSRAVSPVPAHRVIPGREHPAQEIPDPSPLLIEEG